MSVPSKQFSNSLQIPVIGFGTFKVKLTKLYISIISLGFCTFFEANDEAKLIEAIKEAIKIGYRHLDCAWAYRNEASVGKALKEAIEESNGQLKREDFFITSKIWNTHHSKPLVRKCLQETLDSLNVDYLDLLLVHWPFGYAENTGKEPFPFDDNGKMRYSDIHYLETYKAMEELCKEGNVKSIGISNFNIEQVDDILNNCEIKPVVNQFEVNIYNQNRDLINHCHNKGIVVTAYAPLGANDRGWMKPEDPIVLENEIILRLSKKYNRTPAQICINWIIKQGLVVLVKSVTPSRLQENLNVSLYSKFD